MEEIIEGIEVWDSWVQSYKEYVPLFIQEAQTKNDWSDWESTVFNEYFEKNREQCVSSLQQGYYTNEEKTKIKANWPELAPLLVQIANNQSELDLLTYDAIRKWLGKYTSQNRKAAANRLIASLQPQLLCTIVNEDRLKVLMHRINSKDVNAKLPISNNWFENSNAVLCYFRDHFPDRDVFEIMTYPWQVYDYFNSKKNYPVKSNDMSEIQDATEHLNLLQYKKQIILQGPPGTGKTRLAKEMFHEILAAELKNEINESYLRNTIKIGYEFSLRNGKVAKIENIKGEKIILNIKNNYEEVFFTIHDVIDCYEKKCFIEKDFVNYNQYVVRSIVSHIIRKLKVNKIENQYKLIQFHPSYSYEDFVRGIVAESKGEKIEYKSVNKTLGLFAQKALKNYVDSKKEVSTISREKWLDDNFNLFVEKIAEDLNNDKLFKLTDNVNIVDLEDSAFLYIGNAWKGYEHRMLFKDIKQAFLDGNSIRKDLSNNLNISGSARQHATYYVLVLKAFLDFVKDKPFKENDEDGVVEKSFVLIIDEINRANLSSVLGELIYALEYRGEEVESMYEVDNSQKLILPPNLYIIGTMNTADRSVGHIDYAIRRRFAFVDVPPKELQNNSEIYFNSTDFLRISSLFNEKNVSKEFEIDAVKIGHSYFIVKKADAKDEVGRDELFNLKMQYEVKPILLEYERDGILIGEYEGKSIKEYIKSL